MLVAYNNCERYAHMRRNRDLHGLLLTLSQTRPGFTCLLHKSFENTEAKGEIAHNEQFLLFPQCFSTRLEKFVPLSSDLKLSSTNSFSLKESKICRLGKGQLRKDEVRVSSVI